MPTLVETGAASASGSIVAYIILKLIKRARDKTKINGLLLLKGKTYCQKNFSTENVIFIDIDDFSKEKTKDLEMHEIRLKIYPEIREYLKQVRSNFQNKRIIICSSSIELLRYLDIKKIYAILPSARMMNEQISKIEDIDMNELEKLRLIMSVKIKKKKQRICESWNHVTTCIRKIFHIEEQII